MFGRSARSALRQMPQPTLPPMQSSQQAGLQQAFQQRQSPPGDMQMGLMGQSPGLQPQSAGQSAMQQSPSGQLALQQAFQQRQPSPGGMQMGMGMGLQPQQTGSPGQTAAGFGNPYEAALQQMQQQQMQQMQQMQQTGLAGQQLMANPQGLEQQAQQMQSTMQQSPYYAQMQDINRQMAQLAGGQFVTPEMEQNPQMQALRQQEQRIAQNMQSAMQQSPSYAQMFQQPSLGQSALQQALQQQQQQQMGALGQTPLGSMQTGMGMPPQQMALQQALMQQQSMPQGQVPIGIPGQTLGFLGSQQGGLASLVPPQIRAMPAPPRRGFSSFGSRR